MGGELERRLNQSQFKNERKGKAPANIIFAYHYMHKARETFNQLNQRRRYGNSVVVMVVMTIITKTMLKMKFSVKAIKKLTFGHQYFLRNGVQPNSIEKSKPKKDKKSTIKDFWTKILTVIKFRHISFDVILNICQKFGD